MALRTSRHCSQGAVLAEGPPRPVLGLPHLEQRSRAVPEQPAVGREGGGSPPCYEQEVQVCRRGRGWTGTCWFLNSIVPLGQSGPAAAEPHTPGIPGRLWPLC